MSDPRIHPRDLRIGDVITSDPRRDFPVRAIEADGFGGIYINRGEPDQARIDEDQTVTIRPRH